MLQKKKMISCVLVLFQFFSYFYILVDRVHAAPASHILINEVQYDAVQSGTDTTYEWFELYNPTGAIVDISDWTINDNQYTYTFPSGTKIYSGYTLLIANNTGFSTNYPSQTPNITIAPGTQLPLSNSADKLELKNSSGALIDVVGWGGGISGWTQTTTAGTSLCRIDDSDINDSQLDWQSCATPTPTAGPNPVYPTDIALSANTQAENTGISTTIGTFSSTDADGGDMHSYSLSCAISGLDDTKFSISGNNLQNTVVFDYENPVDSGTDNIYNICIRSTDSYGLYFDKNFTVSITDVDEIAPIISIIDDVAVGPTMSDTINLTVSDANILTGSLEYGFSNDVICDVSDTYGNSFTSGIDFTITTEINNGLYMCFKATDVAGNTSYAVSTQTLDIDVTAPNLSEITPVATLTNDTTPSYTFSSDEIGVISYGGDCSSTATGATTGNNTITFNTLGEGTYSNCTISVTDAVGNVSSALNISSFIVDTTAANISVTQDIDTGPLQSDTFQLSLSDTNGVQSAYFGFSHDAICDANDTFTTILFSLTPFVTYSSENDNGKYVCVEVTDNAENISYQISANPLNIDVTPPVITRTGSGVVTVNVGDTYTDGGATASDNYDGDITGDVVTVNPVNTSLVGSYVVTYNVTDTADNTAIQVTRTVNVVDTDMPVITLLGTTPVDVEVFGVYTDGGATASDNYDGDITGDIVTVNPVNTSLLGSYTVTYNVQDSNLNDAIEVQRVVNVVDTTIPVITLLGFPTVNVELGGSYTDAGATASDNYDGNLTSSIVVSGDSVNPNTLGTYLIHYDVQDTSNNDALQVTRTVNVVDTTYPVITFVDNIVSGPVINDTVNVTATDIDLDGATLKYGFSADAICDGADTYPNTYSSGGDIIFSSEGNNGTYLCFKASDITGNTTYVASANPLNIDVTNPSISLTNDVALGPVSSETVASTITDTNLLLSQYAYSSDILCNAADFPGTAYVSATNILINTESHNGQYVCFKGEDSVGNISYQASANPLNIDVTVPTISQVTAVTSPTTETSPSYTFFASEAGSITYGGSCSSSTTTAVSGNNTVTFNSLGVGTYNDCTITVTDTAGNVSETLNVNSFVIENPPVPSTSNGGGGSGGGVSPVNNLANIHPSDLKVTRFTNTLVSQIRNVIGSDDIKTVSDIFQNNDNIDFSGASQESESTNFPSENLSQDIITEQVQCLTLKNIISGDILTDNSSILQRYIQSGILSTSGNTFEGSRNITRIEVLKILFRTFCISYSDMQGLSPFSDIESSTWQAKISQKAFDMGIVNGQMTSGEKRIFRPNDDATFTESLKMLFKIMGANSSTSQNWEDNYMQELLKLGTGKELKNTSFINRMDFLTMLYKILMEKQK